MVLFAQIWSFIILAALTVSAILVVLLAALAVAAILVGRDARKKGLSWLESIGWGAVTLFIFPIGLGLYLLLRRRNV